MSAIPLAEFPSRSGAFARDGGAWTVFMGANEPQCAYKNNNKKHLVEILDRYVAHWVYMRRRTELLVPLLVVDNDGEQGGWCHLPNKHQHSDGSVW